MSRSLLVPSAAFVASALVLSGCSGGGASTATSAATAPSSTAATSPSSDTSSATSSKPAPLRPTDPLGVLDRASFEPALLTSLQVSKFAPDMARSTSGGSSEDGDPAGDDVTYAGEGSCATVATSLNEAALFGSSQDDNVGVSYDNSDVISSLSELRGIDHTIATKPTGNLVADLAKYRTAIMGCSAPLIGDDGSRVRLRLQPTPAGLGSNAVVSVSTSGFGSAERARILTQVQKNLAAKPVAATATATATSSSGAV